MLLLHPLCSLLLLLLLLLRLYTRISLHASPQVLCLFLERTTFLLEVVHLRAPLHLQATVPLHLSSNVCQRANY